MQKQTNFIAHRGLSGRFAENSHTAFNAAWQADCDGIELDIQVSKDGKVIVMHDENTHRTCAEDFLIKNTNWQELKNLNPSRLATNETQAPSVFSTQDVKTDNKLENNLEKTAQAPLPFSQTSSKFVQNETIPLLSEVVEAMPKGKIIQIEIKHQIENLEAVIVELSKLRQDILPLIISFDPKKLLDIKQALPKLTYLLLQDEEVPPIKDPIKFATEYKLDGLDLHYPLIDEAMAQNAKAHNLQLGGWTVNSKETAKFLKQQGVAYIASDFADTFLDLN